MTATPTGTSLYKRYNEQNNGCARALYFLVHFFVFLCKQTNWNDQILRCLANVNHHGYILNFYVNFIAVFQIHSNLVPVHTYPDIFESATFSFRIRLPSTRIRRVRQRSREKSRSALQSGKNKSAANPITCGRVNPDIVLSDAVKACPVSHRTINQYGGTTWRANRANFPPLSRFTAHALKAF